jgi:SAM-dependent methyltransferase
MGDGPDRFAATIRRFSGFAHEYDSYRAQPPAGLAARLAQYTQTSQARLVVDLGSGTGLSTRYWEDQALRVIGIEPSSDMRDEALRHTGSANVSYQAGYSHDTGLPAGCAQIVTCMQALHWMEPQGTFAEARRILAPGGVFAAIDYDWPPMTRSWRADQAWLACNERAIGLEAQLPGQRPPRWDKAAHATRMRASGCFQFVRESVLHHIDAGNSERYVGLLRSQGSVMDLLKAGYSEQDLGITELEALVRAELGIDPAPWHWSARVRIGVV